MARNSEKAQSMLYRFRETQAIEMGLGNRQKGDRRPRMASSCTNLREAERWRGDILKEISRKVSKIQDANLSDYEVRDLNDEINSLMREKRHWETQIVNLGGANYKRGNASMVDDDGKEVPGTRGYKYFGRARELPGVKEMFSKGAAQATEESARNASFQMFRNQGPEYFGDRDELDVKLIEEEEELAREAVAETAAALGLAESTNVPYPTPSTASSSKSQDTASAAVAAPSSSSTSTSAEKPAPASKSKRKTRAGDKAAAAESADSATPTTAAAEAGEAETAAEGDEDIDMDASKKAKTTDNELATGVNADANANAVQATPADPAMIAARQRQAAQAANFLGMLDPRSLEHPVMPSVEEMGRVLLEVRKNALRAEYGI